MDHRQRQRAADLLRQYRRLIRQYKAMAQGSGMDGDAGRRFAAEYQANLDGARDMLEELKR